MKIKRHVQFKGILISTLLILQLIGLNNAVLTRTESYHEVSLTSSDSNSQLETSSNIVSFLWQFYTGDFDYPTEVVMSENGQYIALSVYNSVYLFGKSSNTPLWSYDLGSFVYDIEISSDGSYLIAGSGNDLFFFNTTTTAPKIPEWQINYGYQTDYVDISADGFYIVTGTENNDFHLFNRTKPVATKQEMWTHHLSSGIVKGIEISADGSTIIGLNSSGPVSFFNTTYSAINKNPEWTYNATNPELASISSDGEISVVANDNNQTFLINQTLQAPYRTLNFADEISDVKISEDGSYFTVLHADRLRYYDTTDPMGPKLSIWSYVPSEPGKDLKSSALSSDGQYITTGSESNSIYLFNSSYTSPKNYIFRNSSLGDTISVAISSDGKYFAGVDEDNRTLSLYSYSTTDTSGNDDDDDDDDDDSDTSVPPSILGFNIFFILFSIGLPIIILTKIGLKRLNKKNQKH